jgi:hypothetical protein
MEVTHKMFEQSKYFEDFENAANYVDGRFDPKAAEALRASVRRKMEEQRREVRTIAQQHKPQPQRARN